MHVKSGSQRRHDSRPTHPAATGGVASICGEQRLARVGGHVGFAAACPPSQVPARDRCPPTPPGLAGSRRRGVQVVGPAPEGSCCCANWLPESADCSRSRYCRGRPTPAIELPSHGGRARPAQTRSALVRGV